MSKLKFNVEADSREVYVSYADLTEDAYMNGTEVQWLDLIVNVQSLLPDSFGKYDLTQHPIRWHGGGVLVACNELASVVVRDKDGCTATVRVIIEEECEHLNQAMRHLDNYADALFEQLDGIYELFVGKSAWTSGRYIRRHAA
jgi:hypothetical protein